MVQSIDFNKPVYNAVSINIKNPEVNAEHNKQTNPLKCNKDSGIYNAVKIDIDEPKVNTKPKKVYDYPNADSLITYEMLNINPIPLPVFPQNEDIVIVEETPKTMPETDEFTELPITDEDADTEVPKDDNTEVPAPNYTTVEEEKGNAAEAQSETVVNNEDKLQEPVSEDVKTATDTALSFKGNTPEETVTDETTNTEAKKLNFRGEAVEQKKPEIIPSQDILPKVDIPLVVENLTSSDMDVQAQQMEEIIRTILYEPKTAKNYIVSDVFSELIKITETDVTKLAPPTKEQNIARLKLIKNIEAIDKDEKALNNLPYKMSDEEIALALNLSPLEMAERNKEYAVSVLGGLAELFIEDYLEKEGKIVPITDTPGVSAIVNTLRRDPNSTIKAAAIDALRYIKRPEYKEELSALFTMAQTDPNPIVSGLASKALQELNNIS